jgi:feruloyl esterase
MHGLADQLIPHEGSIDYYERVQKQMGGAAKAAEFARLFLVPGVDHGFRGPGASPNPNRVFLALCSWVEEGKAPDQLPGEARDASGKLLRTRPVFPYPQTAKYSGSGDPNDAKSFVSQTPGR